MSPLAFLISKEFQVVALTRHDDVQLLLEIKGYRSQIIDESMATVNSERYIKTLTKLKARIARNRTKRKKLFLHCDNARPFI